MAEEDEAQTFTQDDVTAAATKAAKEAERKARQSTQQTIAEELGCTVEEAKAVIAAKAEADAANQTELDKARNAASEADKARQAAEARAAQIETRSTATTALVTAKVNPSALGDALRLIDLDAEDLDAEVKVLAERLPALFTEAPTATPVTGIKPPKAPPSNGSKPQTMAELGQQALRDAGIRVPDTAA